MQVCLSLIVSIMLTFGNSAALLGEGKVYNNGMTESSQRTCSGDFDCIPGRNQICVNGQCYCDNMDSIFDNNLGACVGKVGGSCNKYYGKCVKNAYCSSESYRPPYGRGVHNHQQQTKCECDVGFLSNQDGMCYGDIWTPCEPINSPCGSGLICSGGICTCPYSEYQDYNRTSKQCVSQLYGPCEGNITCEANAECRDDNGIMECLCKDGYVESQGKQCKLAYGSKCDTPFSWNCDVVAGLICKNGTCACRELQMYDEEKKTCRGLVGSNCAKVVEDFCVEGAFCKPLRDMNLQDVCRCNATYKVEPDSRTCIML